MLILFMATGMAVIITPEIARMASADKTNKAALTKAMVDSPDTIQTIEATT